MVLEKGSQRHESLYHSKFLSPISGRILISLKQSYLSMMDSLSHSLQQLLQIFTHHKTLSYGQPPPSLKFTRNKQTKNEVISYELSAQHFASSSLTLSFKCYHSKKGILPLVPIPSPDVIISFSTLSPSLQTTQMSPSLNTKTIAPYLPQYNTPFSFLEKQLLFSHSLL